MAISRAGELKLRVLRVAGLGNRVIRLVARVRYPKPELSVPVPGSHGARGLAGQESCRSAPLPRPGLWTSVSVVTL